MWPLWTLLCQPTRFAGGGKTSVTGPSERCYVCLSAVPFFTEAGDVTCSLTKSKSQLSLFTELSALTSSRHSSLHIAAFSSKL